MLLFLGITSCEQKVFKEPDDPVRDSLDVYVKQAELGDAESQYFAARLLLEECNKEDTVRAIEFLKKSADADYPLAENMLGKVYSDSIYNMYDISKAVKWHQKASDNGYWRSMQALANLYVRGKGVDKDYSKAMDLNRQYIECLVKLVNDGDVVAMFELGNCVYNGRGISQSQSEGVEWYKKAANLGYWKAQSVLATCYMNGNGDLEKDEKTAFKWIEKAAHDEKHPIVLAQLAEYYRNGIGVEQDLGKAFELNLKAAEKGNSSAQFRVAYSYSAGEGVAQDYSESFKWYMKLAEKNDAGAQNNIGAMYKNGQGVSQNYSEAFKWYKKAAEQGLDLAQAMVGSLYLTGLGTDKDEVEAVKWLTKSAMQDNAVGQNLLAYCYANGIGVPRDQAKAAYWADAANKR